MEQSTRQLLKKLINEGKVTMRFLSKDLDVNYSNLSKFRNGYFSYSHDKLKSIDMRLKEIDDFYNK